MRIAILDSGICSSLEALDRVWEPSSKRGSAYPDSGHATAVAGIINSYVPNARLVDIPVFQSDLTCSTADLVNAVDWCAKSKVDLINLSLGTTCPPVGWLRERVTVASRSAVIVAAEHNLGLESYPASFPEVIGVTGAAIHEPGGYYYRPGEKIECVARGDRQRLCWLNGRHVFLSGNSFAAPHITGRIAKWMEEDPGMTLPDVRQKLQENALPEPEPMKKRRTIVDMAVQQPNDLSWIRKAVVYPMNKEMHAMVRYSDQLTFEIVGVADRVGKGMVGKDVGEAIGVEAVGLTVKPRIQNLMDVEADTFILGYVDQLGRIEEKNLIEEYVGLALDNGLNVFSFHPVMREIYPELYTKAEQKGLRIAYPDVGVEEANQALQYPNRYANVDVPVVAVLGTSSQQGKFTLQLALRRRLKQLGYRVGQLGTEHHSQLFGMEVAFPIGYASPVRLPIRYHVPYLDYKMREINDRSDPDIILVGSQSGTIPYDIIEHSTHSVTSVPFLFGTKPDACVLVVNAVDPDDYVQDTIDAIRLVAKCKTIAIAISDKTKHIRSAYGQSLVTPEPLTDHQIDEHLSRLERRFRLPAFCIARDQDVIRMTDKVLAYFADQPDADRAGEEAKVEYAAD